MSVVTFADNRKALSFGGQKINLHQYGNEFSPKAYKPTPGSADVCFVTSVPLSDVISHLASCGIDRCLRVQLNELEHEGLSYPYIFEIPT